MKAKCCIETCPNKNYNKDNTREKVNFFSFPKDPKLKKKWLDFCGKTTAPLYWTVCHQHFTNADMIGGLQCDLGLPRRRMLRAGAVPTILNNAAELDAKPRGQRLATRTRKKLIDSILEEDKKRNLNENANDSVTELAGIVRMEDLNVESWELQETFTKKAEAKDPLEIQENNSNEHEEIVQFSIENLTKDMRMEFCQTKSSELTELKKETPAMLRTKIAKLTWQNKDLTKKLQRKAHSIERILYEKNKELQRLKTSLSITETRFRNIITRLRYMFTDGQVSKLLKGDSRRVWTSNDINAAMTIYNESRKVYAMLLNRKFPLPSIRTLQKWSQRQRLKKNINCVEDEDNDENIILNEAEMPEV